MLQIHRHLLNQQNHMIECLCNTTTHSISLICTTIINIYIRHLNLQRKEKYAIIKKRNTII